MSLGVHWIRGETLLALLKRVAAGEDPEMVYMEMWANGLHIKLVDDDEEAGDE